MGYVYKYTHKETGKWYIGSHNGADKNYNGSGLIWKYAKEKYGIDSFDREILYEGNDFREEEKLLIELNAARDPMSYNMKNQALGGTFFGEANGMFGKTHTDEEKYKCGSARRGKKFPDHSEKMKGEKNPMYGKSGQTHGLVKYSKDRIGVSNEEFFGKEKATEIARKIRKANLNIRKPGTSKANTGGGNPSAKKVQINGVLYSCIKEAMKILDLSRYEILKIGTFTS